MADHARSLFADMRTKLQPMPAAVALSMVGDDVTPGRAAVGMLCAELFVGLRRVGCGGRIGVADRWGAYLIEAGVDAEPVLENLRCAIRSKHAPGLPDVAAILRDDVLRSDDPARLVPHLVALAAVVSEQESGLWIQSHPPCCC